MKSSIDKFFAPEEVRPWPSAAAPRPATWSSSSAARSSRPSRSSAPCVSKWRSSWGCATRKKFAPLWVVDFPLFEWDEETQRYYAMHHPFTSPKPEDVQYLKSDPGRVRANAYDFVCNGTELGGGSIRIHDQQLQAQMFECLGFTPEAAAQEHFGFLMNAFKYGAPPHGGLAFGFDRLCSLFGGSDSIRDYIAFP